MKNNDFNIPKEKVWEVEVEVSARATIKVRLAADTQQQAEQKIDKWGEQAFENDWWEEFLDLADYDVEILDDPIEVEP